MAIYKNIVFVMMFLLPSFAFAQDNEIYIDQSGAGVTIDITQDGSGNKVGGSDTDSTKMLISGDNIALSIDAVGTGNDVIGNIVGDNNSVDLDVVGSTNAINLNIDAADVYGSTWGSFNLNLAGSGNNVDLDVAGNDQANNADFDWLLDGDYNTLDFDIDANDYTSEMDIIGDNNTLTVDVDGYDGHSMNIDGSGSYWDVTIDQQSTLQTDSLEIDFNGSGTSTTPATICISQSDSGTATGCN